MLTQTKQCDATVMNCDPHARMAHHRAPQCVWTGPKKGVSQFHSRRGKRLDVSNPQKHENGCKWIHAHDNAESTGVDSPPLTVSPLHA